MALKFGDQLRQGDCILRIRPPTHFGMRGRHFNTDRYVRGNDHELAGGMTLSAVVGKTQIMDAPHPGGLGGTYAGNPLAVAASLAVLKVMDEEQLPQRAKRLGDQLLARLNAVRATQPRISDVRGLGAMVACELVDPATGQPDPDFTKRVQQAALKQGLLLLTCGVYGNVIRFLFPLTIEDAVFEEALLIIECALASV